MTGRETVLPRPSMAGALAALIGAAVAVSLATSPGAAQMPDNTASAQESGRAQESQRPPAKLAELQREHAKLEEIRESEDPARLRQWGAEEGLATQDVQRLARLLDQRIAEKERKAKQLRARMEGANGKADPADGPPAKAGPSRDDGERSSPAGGSQSGQGPEQIDTEMVDMELTGEPDRSQAGEDDTERGPQKDFKTNTDLEREKKAWDRELGPNPTGEFGDRRELGPAGNDRSDAEPEGSANQGGDPERESASQGGEREGRPSADRGPSDFTQIMKAFGGASAAKTGSIVVTESLLNTKRCVDATRVAKALKGPKRVSGGATAVIQSAQTCRLFYDLCTKGIKKTNQNAKEGKYGLVMEGWNKIGEAGAEAGGALVNLYYNVCGND